LRKNVIDVMMQMQLRV